jgi:hypothetical protein
MTAHAGQSLSAEDVAPASLSTVSARTALVRDFAHAEVNACALRGRSKCG